jgi:hypothetical protein
MKFSQNLTLLHMSWKVYLDFNTFIVSRRIRKAWKRSNTILGWNVQSIGSLFLKYEARLSLQSSNIFLQNKNLA